MPIDKYHDALLTPRETARHLQLSPSTLNYWLRDQAVGEALVHRVPPVKRGWPSVPFIAVIEAYVLRSLRDLGLSKKKIHDAAAAVRREFKTSYGLATQRIVTDGIDIFVSYADGDLVLTSQPRFVPLSDKTEPAIPRDHRILTPSFSQLSLRSGRTAERADQPVA